MVTAATQATKKSARKSDELLARIIEIVRRTGLAGFSLETLAPELGTSSRMLVYYFGSKDELLGRIVYAVRSATVEAFASQPAATITEAIDHWWNYYRANMADMQFFFHLASRSFEEPDKFEEFSSTAVSVWTSYFHQSLHGVTKSDAEAQAIARLALATVRGLMVDQLITGETARVEEALAEFKSLLGDRLSSPRGRRRTAR
ncbi:TetR/AcrR family transcriptional regulator [Micromonospora sp. WMMD1102]|uniref:TetR/AcrR family transcriptional regulator n=1 Tax=Micromonospora sp. WMMD1102 TaxID=3016105 RepID=UPI0024155446|nr:TetR/AcrR family transcriptional regulator [Micromonospora sp. WMMD1102]MDG4788071.1 TetR/AcrR family transcriptional regulator [Micromonospora sp. WMMD1102]